MTQWTAEERRKIDRMTDGIGRGTYRPTPLRRGLPLFLHIAIGLGLTFLAFVVLLLLLAYVFN